MWFLFLLWFSTIIILPCYAKQGCCSYHNGVCGNSCCDGTPLSLGCGGVHEINLEEDCKLKVETMTNIEQSQMYIGEAENLLQNSSLQNDEIYLRARVFDLYEIAERELQYALERTMDKDCRNSIEATIMMIREVEDKIFKEKREFENRIKTAIQDNQVILGMTKSDVINSWGQPDDVSKINDSRQSNEKWRYKKQFMGTRPTVYLLFEKLPYFDNEILILIQYR